MCQSASVKLVAYPPPSTVCVEICSVSVTYCDVLACQPHSVVSSEACNASDTFCGGL